VARRSRSNLASIASGPASASAPAFWWARSSSITNSGLPAASSSAPPSRGPGQRQAAAGPHQPAQQRQRGPVEVVRVVGAQHHGPGRAQLVHEVERLVAQIPRRGRAAQKLPGRGEGIVAPARLTGHPDDPRRTRRHGTGDLASEVSLADAGGALDDDAGPGRTATFGEPMNQIVYGPGDRGPVRWRRPVAGQIRHRASIRAVFYFRYTWRRPAGVGVPGGRLRGSSDGP
jgi:hypothetical protein